MKIAQVAPLWERVPPLTYGGVELVVSLLTDELVKRGHDVTLFASGDSISRAKLESVHPRAIRLDKSVEDYQVYEALQLKRVYEQADAFDLIHAHMGFSALVPASFSKTPTVHTLHGTFTDDRENIYDEEKDQAFINISNAQQRFKPDINYVATVYNGIDVDSYDFYEQPADPPYLAFLGRLCEDKGTHLAIAIAKKTGYPLKIAGKIDDIHREYYHQKVEPEVDGEQIEFLGEMNHAQKNELLGKAIATLFPITWNEPFGLVMVESMAAGTPVIGLRAGSTPEVIADGKSGFLCDSLEECIAAMDRVSTLSRRDCRQHVLDHFSVRSMVDGYEAVYQKIMTGRSRQQSRRHNPLVTVPAQALRESFR